MLAQIIKKPLLTEKSKMLFEDGKYKPEDCKSFLKVQTSMGTSKKSTIGVDNGSPGPGLYKIKGFAEEVKEKGDKINEARVRIRNKQLEQEMKEKGEQDLDKKPKKQLNG